MACAALLLLLAASAATSAVELRGYDERCRRLDTRPAAPLSSSNATAVPAAGAEHAVLQLSDRSLTSLQGAALSSPNTSSVTVNLSFNAISSWGDRPFAALRNVTVLDLSHNRLRGVDGAALADVASVRELNLSHNSLDTLVGRPFRALVRLVSLDLSNNRIRTLNGSSLGDLVALQSLNLDNNRLVSLGDSDFCGLSRLQRLVVAFNAISSVTAGALRGLNGLSELNVGDNPDVSSIVLVGRRLVGVSLGHAHLTAVPASLTRSVRALYLPGNSLTAIASGDLDSYPLLRELDLTDNRLEVVEDDALGRLEQLAVLRLSANLLRVVPPGLPAALVTLELDKNHIRSLIAGDFQGLGRLRELSLQQNDLHELPAGVFRFLESLEILDLSLNPLVALHADALEGLSRLRELRLTYLTELKSPASWLPFPVASERLTNLDVSGSPVLASQLFSDTAALTAMRRLADLRVKKCNLSTLRPDLPSLLTRLRILRLNGNPWNCSESLLFWLPAWVAGFDFCDSSQCAEPASVRGEFLTNLSKSTKSEDSTVKLNLVLKTTPPSPRRSYPPTPTYLPSMGTLPSSPATINSQPSVAIEEKLPASTLATTTKLTASESSASSSSTLRHAVSTTPSPPLSSSSPSPSPSSPTTTNTPTSKDAVPTTRQRGSTASFGEASRPSSPANKFNQEVSPPQIPVDTRDPSKTHVTAVRDKHSGEPQREAINLSAWGLVSTSTMAPRPSPTANGAAVLSLTTAADHEPSASPQTHSPSTTSSTTPRNASEEASPDSQTADSSHSRVPLPSREALTAERGDAPPRSSTSSLLAMFGVGAVGSALILLVLAAAHVAPRPRLDFVTFDSHRGDMQEDDDDDSRTELW